MSIWSTLDDIKHQSPDAFHPKGLDSPTDIRRQEPGRPNPSFTEKPMSPYTIDTSLCSRDIRIVSLYLSLPWKANPFVLAQLCFSQSSFRKGVGGFQGVAFLSYWGSFWLAGPGDFWSHLCNLHVNFWLRGGGNREKPEFKTNWVGCLAPTALMHEQLESLKTKGWPLVLFAIALRSFHTYVSLFLDWISPIVAL